MKNNNFALGGIDMIMSMATTSHSMLQQAQANRNQKAIEETMKNKQMYENDSLFLKDFNLSGSATEYYSKGGSFKHNARKIGNISNFKPIANNIFEVTGKKHSQGGEKLPWSPTKEVERGELVKITPEGTKVLSDRDDYFGYSPADNAKMNPSMFEEEFTKQESMKPYGTNNGVSAIVGDLLPFDFNNYNRNPNYKLGRDNNAGYLYGQYGKVGIPYTSLGKMEGIHDMYPGAYVGNNGFDRNSSDWKNTVLGDNKLGNNPSPDGGPGLDNKKPKSNFDPSYFIDNITNAITTANTPKPIPPAMIPLTKLNSNVDVNPMIDSIRGNERGNINYINKNISDSNVATAMATSVGNQATAGINDIRSKEINAENEIKNKEAQLNIYPKMQNANAINNFQNDITNRRLGINSAINENANNLSRDLIDIKDKAAMAAKDDKRMNILLATDTEGSLSELIKNGQFDDILFNGKFNPKELKGSNARAYAERNAMIKMNRNGK